MTLQDIATQQVKAESATPAVRVVDLSKRYQGRMRKIKLSPVGFAKSFIRGTPWVTVALDRVNISVNHGEVFGLLGPNGSGKTTLIKILSNLVIPDSGTAYVEGINVVKQPYASAARIQTVLSESIGLEKRISAKENLRLFASLYNVPRSEADEKIDRLINFFGLTQFADKTSQSFSTGMSRKLAVCRVLLSPASVIVFDEPTSGMDPTSADDFRRLILQDLVKREKKTIIMATHNLNEAMSMCTHIALLNRGVVLATGTPEEIRKAVEDRVDVTIVLGGEGGPLSGLRDELSKVYGIQSVEVVDVLSARQVRLSGRKDLNYLEALTLISARGLKVISLETSAASLEDAFLKLVRGDKK